MRTTLLYCSGENPAVYIHVQSVESWDRIYICARCGGMVIWRGCVQGLIPARTQAIHRIWGRSAIVDALVWPGD